MAKYQWTDWITHVPGQEMPIGTHGLWEFMRSDHSTNVQEGTITSKQKGHGCWHATDCYGKYCLITRYKLRSVAEEHIEERKLEEVV